MNRSFKHAAKHRAEKRNTNLLLLRVICGIAITLVPASSMLIAQEDTQQQATTKDATETKDTAKQTPTDDKNKGKNSGQAQPWQELFDGKTLKGWKKTNFGGEGELVVEDGVIKMAMGATLSGITSERKNLPKIDYEIEYEARRTDGLDFFAALTFQFKDSHCTFLPGGWTGTVTGLSNIDEVDASENDTSVFYDFNDNEWYKFRVAVRSDSIRCWINDKPIINRAIKEEKITIRPEVLPSAPLGISAWQSETEVRSIRLRKLNALDNNKSEDEETDESSDTKTDSVDKSITNEQSKD